MNFKRSLLSFVFLAVSGMLHSEQSADFIGPKLPLATETKIMSCQMLQRVEDRGGIVNGMNMGKIDVISLPHKKDFPFELRYSITPEAGEEFDLIDQDYFPMSLISLKASSLFPKFELAKDELLDENAENEKRRLRYILDFLQVVGGLYSNVEVYGYHIFTDSKDLALNVVYLSKNMSVLAVAGKYYDNLYSCEPLKEEKKTELADTSRLAQIPSFNNVSSKEFITSLNKLLRSVKKNNK